MRIGLVAEGPSDSILLECLIDKYWQGSEVRRLQPDTTLASHLGAGWKGVRAWCVEYRHALDEIMTGIEGDEIDLLVIHVDCSMAHNVDARFPCPPAGATSDALRKVVTEDWLAATGGLPGFVILMTPAQTTDTWLIAGQDWFDGSGTDIECSVDVDDEFVRRHHFRRRGGEVKKPSARVKPLAEAAANNWGEVIQACGEARRFWSELSASMP